MYKYGTKMKKKLLTIFIDMIVASFTISFYVATASTGEVVIMFAMGILIWAALFRYLEARYNYLNSRYC
jgi:hypothetical protein